MPRKARLNIPGAIYHVMARCLDGQALFTDNQDREFYLSLLGPYLLRNNCRCYAWALMNSHYHLVLRLGDQDLWQVIKPLNMRYAQYHAKKYSRRGPLFMDRYKSIVTQDQNYLQELIRYVHLNPVRAGVVRFERLAEYPWCGDGVLMGRFHREFQDIRTVLRRFGSSLAQGRRGYRQFLREGIESSSDGEDRLISLVRKSNAGLEAGRRPEGWVIGNPEFIREALNESEARRLRIARYRREGMSLEDLAGMVAQRLGIDPAQLRFRLEGRSQNINIGGKQITKITKGKKRRSLRKEV